jgi:hypothetical protein
MVEYFGVDVGAGIGRPSGLRDDRPPGVTGTAGASCEVSVERASAIAASLRPPTSATDIGTAGDPEPSFSFDPQTSGICSLPPPDGIEVGGPYSLALAGDARAGSGNFAPAGRGRQFSDAEDGAAPCAIDLMPSIHGIAPDAPTEADGSMCQRSTSWRSRSVARTGNPGCCEGASLAIASPGASDIHAARSDDNPMANGNPGGSVPLILATEVRRRRSRGCHE